MNKRGQFYIIISLVIAIAAFALTSTPNKVDEAILFEDFEDVTNNYITESEAIVNQALEEQSNDVEAELDDFTKEYLKYAKQRAPNLQLLYVYSDGTNVKLYNYFDDSETANPQENEAIPPGAQSQVVQDVKILVGGKEFSHKVPVQAGEFGSDWYSEEVPTNFELSVGGFVHNFDLGQDSPGLEILVTYPSGDQVSFEYGDEDTPYEFQFSPEQNKIATNQVKKR